MAKSPAKPSDATKTPPAGSAAAVDQSVEAGNEAKPEGASGQLRVKDLVDLVLKSVGGKPKDVREIVLATLVELGAALDRGDGLNLPDFGKGRVARRNEEADGSSSFVIKLKRGGVPKVKEEKEALAEARE